MPTNNFKKLEEEEIKQYPLPPPRIKQNLEKNISLLKMMGDIFELYLPRVVDLFIAIAKGNDDEKKQPEEYSSSDETEDIDPGESIRN